MTGTVDIARMDTLLRILGVLLAFLYIRFKHTLADRPSRGLSSTMRGVVQGYYNEETGILEWRKKKDR